VRHAKNYFADIPGLTWVQATFAKRYSVARELQTDVLFDQILAIADDSSDDWTDRPNKDGSTTRAFDREHVERSARRYYRWPGARELTGFRAARRRRQGKGVRRKAESRRWKIPP
jgi:hypothetical protein